MSRVTNAFEAGTVVIRPATASDDEFLYAVYAATRSDEFASLGWPPEQLEAFLKMQFEMQRRSYALQFPGAEHNIVLFHGDPAGRILHLEVHGTLRFDAAGTMFAFIRANGDPRRAAANERGVALSALPALSQTMPTKPIARPIARAVRSGVVIATAVE